MRAGTLRHRLTIQFPTEAAGSFGGSTENLWTDVTTVWGEVKPTLGKEAERAQMMDAEVTHSIRLRFPDPATVALTPKHRILFGTRIFNIEYVLNITERDRELKLLCFEEV